MSCLFACLRLFYSSAPQPFDPEHFDPESFDPEPAAAAAVDLETKVGQPVKRTFERVRKCVWNIPNSLPEDLTPNCESIRRFCQDYFHKVISDSNSFFIDYELPLFLVQNKSRLSLMGPDEISSMRLELENALRDKETYYISQKRVFHILGTSLQSLLEDRNSPEVYAFAQAVYKSISQFFRTILDPKYIKNYEEYLGQFKSSISSLQIQGAFSYLLPDGFSGPKRVEFFKLALSVFSLMQKLKKQITLKKIACETGEQNISPYRFITWLHASKASVIRNACQKSEGCLLPLGDLRRRNLPVFTGSIEIGGAANGINDHALSGVDLFATPVALPYLELGFNRENEKVWANKLLSLSLLESDVLANGNVCLKTPKLPNINREVEALGRLKMTDPQWFKENRLFFAEKLPQVFAWMRSEVFEKKPLEYFSHHDDYFTSDWRNFSANIDRWERILYSEQGQNYLFDPEQERLATIGVIFASRTKFGIPANLLDIGRQKIEEPYFGGLKLGEDIQFVFTREASIPEVSDLVARYDLAARVTVAPISHLLSAVEENLSLAPELYDVYGIKEWQEQLMEERTLAQIAAASSG